MNLFDRFSNIMRANLGEMLSKAEDPEKMIKLYLEDAKNQLEAFSTAVGDAIATEKLLQKQYDNLLSEYKHWGENATLAVKANRDDLATKALEQETKIEDRIEKLKGPLADAHAQTVKMKENMSILKDKIEETQANADVLISRAKAAKTMVKSAEAFSKISGGSPLDEMASMEKKIMSQEAHAESLADLSASKRETLDDQFQALSSGGAVADKLAALKAKVAQPSA